MRHESSNNSIGKLRQQCSGTPERILGYSSSSFWRLQQQISDTTLRPLGTPMRLCRLHLQFWRNVGVLSNMILKLNGLLVTYLRYVACRVMYEHKMLQIVIAVIKKV